MTTRSQSIHWALAITVSIVAPGCADLDDGSLGADAGFGSKGDSLGCPRVRITAGRLNVRPTPSTGEGVVASLPGGSIVTVLDRVDGELIEGTREWLVIESPLATGYISAAYAECTDAPVPSGDGLFYLPLSCNTSARISQGNGGRTSHRGRSFFAYDFAIGVGTPLVAMADGVVLETFDETGPGDRCYNGGPSSCFRFANYVAIGHNDGTASIYKHLSAVLVSEGQTVERGQAIGRSGSTGYSTGPHAHVMRQENCGSQLSCQSVRLPFADVPGQIPSRGQTVRSGNCP